MKITKARLKEIIKEEIEAISEEDLHPRTTLRRHYIMQVAPFGETKIPHNDSVKIDNLAIKVERDELSMADAKEKVSEMRPKEGE